MCVCVDDVNVCTLFIYIYITYYIFITHPNVCHDILSISCKCGKPLRISWSCRRRTSAVRYRSACVKPLNCTSRCCLCLGNSGRRCGICKEHSTTDKAVSQNLVYGIMYKNYVPYMYIYIYICIYIYIYCVYIYIYIYCVCVCFVYTSYCIWPPNRNYKMLKVPSSKSTHLSP